MSSKFIQKCFLSDREATGASFLKGSYNLLALQKMAQNGSYSMRGGN